jgi:hypothetical protein
VRNELSALARVADVDPNRIKTAARVEYLFMMESSN